MTGIHNWRKSIRSGNESNCVEVGNWRKSTRSGNEGDCVEVGGTNVDIAVRDTKLGESSPVLTFDATQWRTFIASTKANGFTA